MLGIKSSFSKYAAALLRCLTNCVHRLLCHVKTCELVAELCMASLASIATRRKNINGKTIHTTKTFNIKMTIK